MPASRSAAESGADLMNCGRLPTIERTRIAATLGNPCGPLAQLVEQGTLNPKVEGSNPSRPTHSKGAANDAFHRLRHAAPRARAHAGREDEPSMAARASLLAGGLDGGR